MERIAEALNVAQSTITEDLRGLSTVDKPSRPKGGRPKGAKKPAKPPDDLLLFACPQWAAKLMKVATDDDLRNGAHERHLPSDLNSLVELTRLTSEQFRAGIKSGKINPKMSRADCAAAGVSKRTAEMALRDQENDVAKIARSIPALASNKSKAASRTMRASCTCLRLRPMSSEVGAKFSLGTLLV